MPTLTNLIVKPRDTLKMGMSGDLVKIAQLELAKRGYALKGTGYFGPATDTAVEAFQKRVGLLVDGELGPLTAKAIDKFLMASIEQSTTLAEISRPLWLEAGLKLIGTKEIAGSKNNLKIIDWAKEEGGNNLSASSKTIKLPNMGTSRSPPVGSKVTIINRNATPANVFAVTDSAGNTIVSALPPNTYVDITTTQFGGPGLSASWQASVRFGIGTTLGVQPLNTGMGGTGITTISPGAFLYGGNNPYNALSTGQITGLVLGNGASAPSAYSGGVCTAQFVRVLSAAGVPTCASVSLTADVSGTLPVANGGTGTTTVAGENARLSTGIINVTVTGIDFSTVSEKLITVPLPTGVTRWAFQQGRLYNASTSLAGSFIQLWQLAGGTGTAMSAATAVTVTSSGPNTTASMQQGIVGSTGTYWNYASFYIRVSTGIGSPATADFTASLVPLD